MCLGIGVVIHSSGVGSTRGHGEPWEDRVNPLLPSESGFERDLRAGPPITVPGVDDEGVEGVADVLNEEVSSVSNVMALDPEGEPKEEESQPTALLAHPGKDSAESQLGGDSVEVRGKDEVEEKGSAGNDSDKGGILEDTVSLQTGKLTQTAGGTETVSASKGPDSSVLGSSGPDNVSSEVRLSCPELTVPEGALPNSEKETTGSSSGEADAEGTLFGRSEEVPEGTLAG